tara:strand:- start:3 stop:212 length:210 start_codon:yes stop_codon:yes gene_type:complete
MIKNREYAAKKRSLGENETEKALFLLEDSYMDKQLSPKGDTHKDNLNESSKLTGNSPSPERVNLPQIKN